jgi:N utilization substance protein A
VRVDTENKGVLVVVEEDQLSLAIGKDGQNVRLASKLTGWQIDLITSREIEQRERLQEHLTMSIEEMVGVTDKIAEKLRAAGISTVQKFANSSDDELLEIPGLGPKTLGKLRETAEGTITELEKALQELIDKENEERIRTKEEEKPLFDESVMTEEEDEGEQEEERVFTEEALFGDTPEEDEESEEEVAAAAESTEDADESTGTESADSADAPAEDESEPESNDVEEEQVSENEKKEENPLG